jgi:hypothetical protein
LAKLASRVPQVHELEAQLAAAKQVEGDQRILAAAEGAQRRSLQRRAEELEALLEKARRELRDEGAAGRRLLGEREAELEAAPPRAAPSLRPASALLRVAEPMHGTQRRSD